jgi:hypothetical protein
MSDSLLMVFGAVACFAVSALLALVSSRRRSRIAASADWPSVAGTVLSNKLHVIRSGGNPGDVSPTYSVALRYRYTVGQESFEGSRIGWGTKSADRKPDIPEAFLREYPEGHAIEIFYDPANPAMAMIDPSGKRFGLVHVNLARVMAWTLGFCGLLSLVFAALS